MATTKISDVIVPERFTDYVQAVTMEKSALVESGALVPDPMLSEKLAGGGSTVEIPSWGDLTNTANISSDDETTNATPAKISTFQLTVPRLSRNGVWSDMDLASELAGSDAGVAIGDRIAAWWARQWEATFIAVWKGVFADNAAAPSGSDTHTQNDMLNDVSASGSYTPGVTDFSAEAFLDALQSLGDASWTVSLIAMHSVVATRAKKNNLIDYIPDSQGNIEIRTYLGHRVIVTDQMPNASDVYDTWLFGPGCTKLGRALPKFPTETNRLPLGGNGGGEDQLISRSVYGMGPAGTRYVGAATGGGPSDTVLDDAASWSRRTPERKQIPAARLLTTEA